MNAVWVASSILENSYRQSQNKRKGEVSKDDEPQKANLQKIFSMNIF